MATHTMVFLRAMLVVLTMATAASAQLLEVPLPPMPKLPGEPWGGEVPGIQAKVPIVPGFQLPPLSLAQRRSELEQQKVELLRELVHWEARASSWRSEVASRPGSLVAPTGLSGAEASVRDRRESLIAIDRDLMLLALEEQHEQSQARSKCQEPASPQGSGVTPQVPQLGPSLSEKSQQPQPLAQPTPTAQPTMNQVLIPTHVWWLGGVFSLPTFAFVLWLLRRSW